MLLSRKTVRLHTELKVIVQRGAIGGPHLPHAYEFDAACFVSSRIADILHQAQSLLSWMPGELELDTASCIMVHRRTPRLLTQSASWIRCYRLLCVLFDLSNKPWSLSVTLPPRLLDHQRSLNGIRKSGFTRHSTGATKAIDYTARVWERTPIWIS